MWTRLSEAKIAAIDEQEARRRRSVSRPLITALLMALPITALWMLGYRGGRMASGIMLFGPQQSVIDWRTLFMFAVSTGVMFVFAYRKQRSTGRGLFSEAPSVICTRCHSVNPAGASARCGCGGEWETTDHWDWTPEAKSAELGGVGPYNNALNLTKGAWWRAA
jgi:hypothetical protein